MGDSVAPWASVLRRTGPLSSAAHPAPRRVAHALAGDANSLSSQPRAQRVPPHIPTGCHKQWYEHQNKGPPEEGEARRLRCRPLPLAGLAMCKWRAGSCRAGVTCSIRCAQHCHNHACPGYSGNKTSERHCAQPARCCIAPCGDMLCTRTGQCWPALPQDGCPESTTPAGTLRGNADQAPATGDCIVHGLRVKLI
jgi:hypothetical protein